MSDRVEITVAVNTVEADASIEAVKARSDAVVKEWRLRRVEIIQGVREAITLISTMMSSLRMAMNLFGEQLDPFYSTLISMVLSTASMILSAGTALAASGIGAGLALVPFSVGLSFNIVTMGKLIADKAYSMGMFDKIQSDIAGFGAPSKIGGGF